MENQKILNLLNEASGSKSVTRKWNIVNDQSKVNRMLEMKLCITQKSNLCDYSDAYIAHNNQQHIIIQLQWHS